jgi:hypothetical protein
MAPANLEAPIVLGGLDESLLHLLEPGLVVLGRALLDRALMKALPLTPSYRSSILAALLALSCLCHSFQCPVNPIMPKWWGHLFIFMSAMNLALFSFASCVVLILLKASH